MSHLNKYLLIGITLFASSSIAHADLVVHELGSRAAKTLESLGTNLVTACAVIAVGIVAAAFVSKKK